MSFAVSACNIQLQFLKHEVERNRQQHFEVQFSGATLPTSDHLLICSFADEFERDATKATHEVSMQKKVTSGQCGAITKFQTRTYNLIIMYNERAMPKWALRLLLCLIFDKTTV